MKTEGELVEKLRAEEERLTKTYNKTAINIVHSRILTLRWCLDIEEDNDLF